MMRIGFLRPNPQSRENMFSKHFYTEKNGHQRKIQFLVRKKDKFAYAENSDTEAES
jgi:hypothetical protein